MNTHESTCIRQPASGTARMLATMLLLGCSVACIARPAGPIERGVGEQPSLAASVPVDPLAELSNEQTRFLSAEQLSSARKWCERMLRSVSRSGPHNGGIRPVDVTLYGLEREYSCQDVFDAMPVPLPR